MTHKVIKDFKGSPNGFTVIEFKKGDDFTHDGELLKVALDEKWVEPIKSKEKKPAKAKEQEPAQDDNETDSSAARENAE